MSGRNMLSNSSASELFSLLKHQNSDAQKEQYIKKFNSCKTNVDRFNFVYDDLKGRKYSDVLLNSSDEKNDSAAVLYREAGNNHFGLRSYSKALKDYTRSIALAASEDIAALAYANRSACLYNLGLHKECMMDIERALNNSYPDDLKPKLIKRRENSERLLKPTESAHEEVPEINDNARNSEFACASNCIEIVTLEKSFAIAKRNIEPGEVIGVEKSSVSVVRENDKLLHCHECLKICYNLIPCNNCTQALFCGESCKEKANLYHKYECPFLYIILEQHHANIQLAVRVSILAKENKNLLKEFHFVEKRSVECNPLLDAVSVTAKLESVILVARCFHLLKQTNFFDNQQEEDDFKNTVMIFLNICPLKIHEYANNKSSYERNCFGYGMYPLFSQLVVHSCPNYNLEKTFYGTTLVIRAVVPIKKGDKCFYSDDNFRNVVVMRKPRYDSIMEYCLHDIKLLEFGNVEGIISKLLKANVKFAKRLLSRLIIQIKLCNPSFPGFQQKFENFKEMICHCYDTLGNKKRV